ncbi:hypothetical protein [Pandoraea anhela]|uniref:Uncharacterized protein n=1 Tax=Pandoraea anhela TaxID=2508295 RepID=A0A5E4XFK9_9BURK|nr:hypothetical protein [Pandoraea anhela]VVE34900.1 hypothetical protein PAN31108_03827 [Pandoraea anhela]
MLYAFGEWVTGALALTHGWNGLSSQQTHVHELPATLTRATAAPIPFSTSPAALSGPMQSATPATSSVDAAHTPITRARVFAERLTDVRPVCVVGRHDDRENCLLDLPPGVHLDVSASHIMLAGCEASLPIDLRMSLEEEGRSARALDRAFANARAAESRGPYAIPTLERRLTKRFNQMAPGMLRLLNHTDAYIEVPQLTFLRTITTPQEARRHGIQVPFTDRVLHIPSGEPSVHDAMLGAYVRIPLDGETHTLLVSPMSPLTIEWIRQTPSAHVREQRHLMFGDIPAHLQTTNLKMRRLAHDGDIARALAEHLHDGHRRYGEFAYGASREALAPTSHAHVRQPICPSPAPTAAQSPAPQSTAANDADTAASAAQNAPAAPDAPRRRRLSRQHKLSVEALAQAIAELERLDKQYKSQARPRFGR